MERQQLTFGADWFVRYCSGIFSTDGMVTLLSCIMKTFSVSV